MADDDKRKFEELAIHIGKTVGEELGRRFGFFIGTELGERIARDILKKEGGLTEPPKDDDEIGPDDVRPGRCPPKPGPANVSVSNMDSPEITSVQKVGKE
jgi:hypothetical protein